MEDQSAAALEVAPEAVVTPETEGQVADPAAATEPETPEAGAEKKSAAAQRREREKANKARLVAERDAALKEAADLKAKHEKLLSIGKAEKAPVETDFTDYAEFLVAKTLYAADQKSVERDARIVDEAAEAARKRAEEIENQEQVIIAQAWAGQVNDAKTRYADFETVAFSGEIPLSEPMIHLIKTSELGADVAYELGKNKAIAAQIAQLSPMEAARAIGRIEGQIVLPRPRTETQAPEPIRPVRGSATPAVRPDELPYHDYAAGRRSGKIK